MGLLRLMALAALASQPGVAGGAEAAGNASGAGLIEFSVGKFRYFKLNRPFPEEAVLRNISSNSTFLIFQIHSQYLNTTVSFSKTLLPSTSGTGTDKGLVFILRPEQSMCSWYLETLEAEPVQNLAIPLSYSERDPIPGGCNLEFDLDVDPNIYLEYDFFETTIKFAPANLGYARGADSPPCDTKTGQDSRWRLQYDIYQYFLPENDLTEEGLLKHLQRMAEVPQVMASAMKVVTLTANDKTSVSFSSLRGQGVIYNVIVWDPVLNTSAAYVPAHTYACSFDATEGNCSSLGRVSTKVFFTLFALLGLFICFFGHRFWKTELFFIGFIFMGFFFYILITRLTPIKYDVRLVLTAIAGSLGGIFLVAAWWRFGILTLCMLCVGLVLGFLVSSVSFFTPLDFIILAVWGMLAVSGITLQIRRERGRPCFPPHPYKLWKRERERRVTNILDPSYHIPPLRERLYGRLTQIRELFQKEQPAGERTPLLL
ncbi:transmembrane 7 superfamily member 3 isoform X5 [Pipistrellus kuhlii]|uniref:transmembrane 7 superfamily member 3 isoform X5 n=1 Tax=Pipistrellus kuhlii TaxID=59472 RepID=UPI001E2715A8|nr:transmembrane 7 superfamily member 3 isoform X5 [Pipistrellus kuhlii]